MNQMIELDNLDELLTRYKQQDKIKSFKKFVESTEEWTWMNWIGAVTPEDFEKVFCKKFIKKNFDELAHDWFKGMEGQVDFGILLDCVAVEFKDKYKEFKKEIKNGRKEI